MRFLFLLFTLLSLITGGLASFLGSHDYFVTKSVNSLCPNLQPYLLPVTPQVIRGRDGCYTTQFTHAAYCTQMKHPQMMRVQFGDSSSSLKMDPGGFRIIEYPGHPELMTRTRSENLAVLREYLSESFSEPSLVHPHISAKLAGLTRSLQDTLRSCPLQFREASLLYCYDATNNQAELHLVDLGFTAYCQNKSCNSQQDALDNLAELLDEITRSELYFPKRFYLATDKFSTEFYEKVYQGLRYQGIQCIVSSPECDSLQLAGYLVQQLDGLNRFGVDPKLGVYEKECSPHEFTEFQNKLLIDRSTLNQPVRIPRGCSRPLIIASKKQLSKLLGTEVLEGSISRESETEFSLNDRFHLASGEELPLKPNSKTYGRSLTYAEPVLPESEGLDCPPDTRRSRHAYDTLSYLLDRALNG